MRLLPQSLDAEQGLICSFLLDARKVGSLCAEKGVTLSHFHHPSNSEIYSVLLQLWAEEKPIDFIILTNELRKAGKLDQVGGPAIVTEIFRSLTTSANAEYYIDILHEQHTLREIITICTEYASRSYDAHDNFSGILSEVQAMIAGIGSHQTHKLPTMKENIVEAINALEGWIGDSDSIICTGLKCIDDDLGPIERGNLVVIAGQTKSGKSLLAGQIALNIAMKGKPVLFISLEMSERELTLRWLAVLSRLDMRMVKTWTPADHDRFALAQQTLLKLPLTIATRRYQLPEIIAVSQQAATRHSAGEPLAAIFFDYAQLGQGSRPKGQELRQQEIAEISRTCKRLAGTLNVLFVLLSQLNDDGRSREARDIENDANLFLEVGHNKETGARGVKVVLARSAPSGQRLKLRIIPQHYRVEDDPDMDTSEQEYKTPPKRNYHK